MRDYRVVARMTTYLDVVIKAKNMDEAWQLAKEADGGEFDEIPNADDWHICDVFVEEEIK